ncbi:hypothetical protein SGPA1_10418 [Streptomyces misionensis JCM 4497]
MCARGGAGDRPRAVGIGARDGPHGADRGHAPAVRAGGAERLPLGHHPAARHRPPDLRAGRNRPRGPRRGRPPPGQPAHHRTARREAGRRQRGDRPRRHRVRQHLRRQHPPRLLQARRAGRSGERGPGAALRLRRQPVVRRSGRPLPVRHAARTGDRTATPSRPAHGEQ